MKSIFLSFCLLASALFLNASEVDTISVFSKSMQKEIKTCVVLPDIYDEEYEFPVLYLLHGYSGNYSSWLKKAPKIKQLADDYCMIIVCPDGGFSSWYFDSPVDPKIKYETYITRELIKYIDKNYNTIKKREARAITGLSMGGHGALFLSTRHQDIFGVAGSMSGGVDIRPFPEKWHLSQRLGDMAEYPENWEKNSVVNLLYLIKDDKLPLIIDCGINDFFIDVNRMLHEKMLSLNIKHDYIERPGVHNWDYWNNAIEFQVLYFYNYFKSNLEQ